MSYYREKKGRIDPQADMKVSPSVAIGLCLAFAGIGLPLLGVTINLYLGAATLLAACAFLLHAIWNWELARQWSESVRVSVLWIVGLVFLSLVFLQIRSQYLKKHTQQLAVSNPASAPAKPQVDKTPPKDSTPAPTPAPAKILPIPHKQKAQPRPKGHPAPRIEQSGTANGQVGGNLTQGPGSIAQVGGSNNTAIIGTQDWLLTRDQQLSIQAGVAKYPGKVRFSWLPMDASSLRYVEALAYAFKAAGWEIVDQVPNYAGSICYPNDKWDCAGASVAVPNRLSDAGKAIISTLSAAVPHLKVMEVEPDLLDIFVAKP
jgi:hypothetical protein